VPVTEWFRGALKEPFRDLVLGSDAVSRDYLDQRQVGKIAEEHADGSREHGKSLCVLFALEVFLRKFF
jgi:asparagine synthase (glutamine-hydrolysing)